MSLGSLVRIMESVFDNTAYSQEFEEHLWICWNGLCWYISNVAPPPLALVYVNRLEPLVAYVKKLYEEISPVSVLRRLVPGLRFLLFPDSFVAVPKGRTATLVWLLFSFLLPLSWKLCVRWTNGAEALSSFLSPSPRPAVLTSHACPLTPRPLTWPSPHQVFLSSVLG